MEPRDFSPAPPPPKEGESKREGSEGRHVRGEGRGEEGGGVAPGGERAAREEAKRALAGAGGAEGGEVPPEIEDGGPEEQRN